MPATFICDASYGLIPFKTCFRVKEKKMKMKNRENKDK